MAKIHKAGEPDGLIQKCELCGLVLQDYTNVLGVGEWRPAWLAENVIKGGNFLATTKEPANCTPPEGMSHE